MPSVKRPESYGIAKILLVVITISKGVDLEKEMLLVVGIRKYLICY